MIAEGDTNGKGKLDYEEFRRIMQDE